MEEKVIGIGSVVQFKGDEIKYVIVDMDIREEMSSVCYDRDYYIIKLDDIHRLEPTENKFRNHLLTQRISVGPNHLDRYKDIPFIVVPNIAPFKIEAKTIYSITQMKAKQITVYE
jgi:hypothetical protein